MTTMTSIESDTISVDPIEWEISPRNIAEKFLYNLTSIDELPEISDTIMGDPKAKTGILLIHGFTGSNLELLFLGNELAKMGTRVLIPILPGHGKNYEALKLSTAEEWYEKVENALFYLRDEFEGRDVVVIGHSLGGSLALRLAQNHSFISAVVPLAAPVRFNGILRFAVRLISRVSFGYPYEEYQFDDKRLKQNMAVRYLEQQYRRVPSRSLGELFMLLEDVFEDLHKINMPIHMIYSEEDYLVPPNQVDIIKNNINSKIIGESWLENSNHILVIDTDKDLVIHEIRSFLQLLNLV